ncbi:MAG TPA: hypothetical protein VGD13_03460 [Xanthobacteraceae bacterium]|jgi:hypothetical protein
MKALSLVAVSGLVLLSFTAASGPAGSVASSGCATSQTVRDSMLRAQFAAVDGAQPVEFPQLCALSRQAVSSAH